MTPSDPDSAEDVLSNQVKSMQPTWSWHVATQKVLPEETAWRPPRTLPFVCIVAKVSTCPIFMQDRTLYYATIKLQTDTYEWFE